MRTLIARIEPENKHISFGSKTLLQIMLIDDGMNIFIGFNRFIYKSALEFVHINNIGSYELKVKR